MDIKRLENNEYAIDKTHKRMKQAINDRDHHDIFVTVGELLLWVITTDDWHVTHNDSNYPQRKINDEYGQKLLGLRHSFNLLKHNLKFVEMHEEKGGLTLPFTLLATLPPIKVLWKKAGDELVTNRQSQKENYEKFIEGEEIIETFDKAIHFLKSEKKNITY
ncbi:hypothetical protein D7Z54_09130 [Salibacterium salarium]|uniref:Uncharacterized protein n=1 Tax=Salibacterium salarium TaxID=284579 RepID=A0A3R9RES4_9BACI|nr:hypothetical protein [Salibacterium salarium]RSL33842.1 hypothetical protein D7Z54_09130 [Salibacterium salarium]